METAQADNSKVAIKSADIRSEQLRITIASIPASLLAILINSSILGVVLWNQIDRLTLVTWFLVTNSLSLIRWLVYKRFNSGRSDNVNWFQIVKITTALSGITWGAAGIWLFSPESLVHQVFLAFVIGGMCAGGITTLAAMLGAGQTFVLMAGSPIIFQFMLINSEIGDAMTIMSLLFMGMILASVSRLNRAILANISESLVGRQLREQAERDIYHLAHYDELTDLPNRRLLQKKLTKEIALAVEKDSIGAVLFIDIDRFKSINYSLGHRVGEEIILQVATRLRSRMGSGDYVARPGPNEFIVLLLGVGSNHTLASEPVTRIAREFHDLLGAPYLVHGHDFHITTSMGAILFPQNQLNADHLIQYAEIGMHHARIDGQNDVGLFSQVMQESVNQRRHIEVELQSALDKGEFELYFQSQFDLQNQVVGSEVLLRWNHPVRGLLLPEQFIEVAEQTGMIVEVGEWVLRSACEYQAILNSVSDLKISVNISPRQFSDLAFIDDLDVILQETQANPKNLKLEITEAMLIDNSDRAMATLQQLRERGIGISIDGFGTGCSSFAQLNRLPLDELKLDKSFVQGIDRSGDIASIADSVILLSQHLKLKLIVQGVETSEEFEHLKARQCEGFQGNLFQAPLSFSGFLEATIH